MTMTPSEPPVETVPYATPAPRRASRVVLAVALLGLGALAGVAGFFVLLRRGYTVTVGIPLPPAPATAPAGPLAWSPPRPPVPLPELDLSGGPVRMTITQRTALAIPGSYGSVFVRIGDITGRQVRLDVDAADGRTLAGGSLREGDALDFTVDGRPFVVVASEFVNALIHDDRGVFVVRRPHDPPDEAETTARLIDAAARSGAVVTAPPTAAQRPESFFGTLDDAGNPRPAAEYLRDAWWFGRRQIRAPGDLARAAARHPAAVVGAGEGRQVGPPPGPVPLRLRFPDGREEPAGEWLQAELAKITSGHADIPSTRPAE
jgi:hypothetical protein